PSSIRATTWFQNQDASRPDISMILAIETNTPASTGTSSAHRNGTLRAQAEHSISQPTVGNAHSAYTGIATSTAIEIHSGLPGPQIHCSGFPPWAMTNPLNTSRKANMVPIAASVASSGTVTVALSALDSTV